MKIFVATADIEAIRWAAQAGFADGVLTTPEEWPESLIDVCRATDLPVCVPVGAIQAGDVYREARELVKLLGDQIIIQVPLVEDAVGAIRRLRADGVRVVATLVFTTAQAVLAAKAGASMVSVAVDELDRHGQNGAEVVRDVRTLFDQHSAACDVMAACPRDAHQFTRCAQAGADVVAVAPDLLRALLVSPLTDRGLDQLLARIAS
ncbi:MAG TPA: transaldolase family protein [Gemmatimonadaceae bacterium]|nr:transaldolase family protein [Gemmatimonadaceae bacterium]